MTVVLETSDPIMFPRSVRYALEPSLAVASIVFVVRFWVDGELAVGVANGIGVAVAGVMVCIGLGLAVGIVGLAVDTGVGEGDAVGVG